MDGIEKGAETGVYERQQEIGHHYPQEEWFDAVFPFLRYLDW